MIMTNHNLKTIAHDLAPLAKRVGVGSPKPGIAAVYLEFPWWTALFFTARRAKKRVEAAVREQMPACILLHVEAVYG